MKGRNACWNARRKGIQNFKTAESLRKAYREDRTKPPFKKDSYREDLMQRFRSAWEANYARMLNSQGIEWEFEPHVFTVNINGIEFSYRPDFYLPKENKYVEIKGQWFALAKQKFDSFVKQYSHLYDIELIDESKYKELIRKHLHEVNLEVDQCVKTFLS